MKITALRSFSDGKDEKKQPIAFKVGKDYTVSDKKGKQYVSSKWALETKSK